MTGTPITDLVDLARKYTADEWKHVADIAASPRVEELCRTLVVFRRNDHWVEPKTERTLEQIEADLNRVNAKRAALMREQHDARLAASPVKLGDIVVDEKGDEYLVCFVDVQYGPRDPFVVGHPKKKNGDWANTKRNVYGWKLVTS